MAKAQTSEVVERIRERRRAMKLVQGRAPKRRPVPRQRQPNAIRLAYFAELRQLIVAAAGMVRERLLPILPGVVEEAAAQRGDGEHVDAGATGRVQAIIEGLANAFAKAFSPERLRLAARKYAERTSDFQKLELARQVRAAIGVDIGLAEPHLSARIEAFTSENVALIKTLPRTYFADIEKTVLADVRVGLRADTIAKHLMERQGVAESRALLIARDQIGKFYGELNEVRQKQLGVDGYYWRTSKDNRVRADHVEREGVRYTWDAPPEDGHPGYPINCRCFADPDFTPLLTAL